MRVEGTGTEQLMKREKRLKKEMDARDMVNRVLLKKVDARNRAEAETLRRAMEELIEFLKIFCAGVAK